MVRPEPTVPAYSTSNGNTSITPPIIPLSMPIIRKGELNDGFYISNVKFCQNDVVDLLIYINLCSAAQFNMKEYVTLFINYEDIFIIIFETINHSYCYSYNIFIK